ncbi:MAG: hypothetical protein WC580_03815 [Agrococcus sp.]
MTSTAGGTQLDHEPPEEGPPRHGMPWTEEDFAAVMQASREGCDQEEIAARIGRSVHGLRSQLRRLLPAEERHLTATLVLPRLRQLDQDGDYDWLAAMAQPTKSLWEVRREVEAERAERGIGTLSDDELLGLAKAVTESSARLPTELARAISTAVQRRGLAAIVRRRALAAADDAVDALLGRGEGPRPEGLLDGEWL